MMKHHPIQTLLDEIWNQGHTPQILVDTTSSEVVIPDHVRARWRETLPIDLDANYPLNIDFSEQGISADLAFQGHTCRCFLPWGQITAVIDRTRGNGFVTRQSHEFRGSLARLEGDQALWAGVPILDCPYPEGSRTREEWLKGWRIAECDRSEERTEPGQRVALALVAPQPESEIHTPIPTSAPVPTRGWVPKVLKGGKA